jgi:NADP-dependent 3-hydroxy acid dehydrogenase YdfG
MPRSPVQKKKQHQKVIDKGFVQEFLSKLKYNDVEQDYTKECFDKIFCTEEIKSKLGSISILQYNAVDYRMKNLMEETVEDLTNGFKISVGNAFAATMELLPELKENKGSILFTGGGSANYPSADMASISLGKAGIRNLALQLHETLKKDHIFVGTVTISGGINPDSETHSPKILAQKFWDLNQARNQVEIIY